MVSQTRLLRESQQRARERNLQTQRRLQQQALRSGKSVYQLQREREVAKYKDYQKELEKQQEELKKKQEEELKKQVTPSGKSATTLAYEAIQRKAEGKSATGIFYNRPDVVKEYQRIISGDKSLKRAVERGVGVSVAAREAGFKDVEEYTSISGYFAGPSKVEKFSVGEQKMIEQETKTYEKLGYSKSESQYLAEEGAKQKMSFTPEGANKLLQQRRTQALFSPTITAPETRIEESIREQKITGVSKEFQDVQPSQDFSGKGGVDIGGFGRVSDQQQDLKGKKTSYDYGFGFLSGDTSGKSLDISGTQYRVSSDGGFFSRVFSRAKEVAKEGEYKDPFTGAPIINITGTTGTIVSAYPSGAGGSEIFYPLTKEELEKQQEITSKNILFETTSVLETKRIQAEKVEEIKQELNNYISKLEKQGKVDTITNSFTGKATDSDIKKYNELYTKFEREEVKVGKREYYIGIGKYKEKKDILEVGTGISLLPQATGTFGGEVLKPLGKEKGLISYKIPEYKTRVYKEGIGYEFVKVPEMKTELGTPEQFKTAGEVGATVGLYAVPVVGTGLFGYEVAKDFKSANFNPITFVRENPVEAVSLATLGTIKGTSKIKSSIMNKRINELQKSKWTFTGTKLATKGDKTLLKISTSKVTKYASAEAEILIPVRQLKNGKFVIETGKGAVYVRVKEPELLGGQLFTKVQTFTTAGKGKSKRALIKTSIGDVLIEDVDFFISSGTGYVVPTGKGYTPFRFGGVGVSKGTESYLIGGEISKLRVYPSKFIGESKLTGLFKIEQRGELRKLQEQFSSSMLGKRVGGKKTPFSKTFEKGSLKLEQTTPELNKLTEGFGAKAIKTVEKEALKGFPKTSQKVNLKALTESKFKSFAGLETKQRQLTKQVPKLKQLTGQVSREKERIAMALDNLTKTIELEKYNQKIFQDVKQAEKTKQKIFTGLMAQQPIIPKLPKLKIPKIAIPRKKEKRELIEKQKQEPYELRIKSRGKWIKVGKKPFPSKKRAEDVGAYFTDTSLPAQFKVKKSKKKPSKKEQFIIPPDYFRREGFGKFRTYQIRKEKKVSLKDRYIEFQNRRLDTRGEVQQIHLAKALAENKRRLNQKLQFNKNFGDLFFPSFTKPKKSKTTRKKGVIKDISGYDSNLKIV